MYPAVSRTFKPFDSSFASGGAAWDPSATSIPSLAPRGDTSLSSPRTYRKFAKPVSRSEAATFSRPSQPASSYIDSYGNNAASKRRKRGPQELNDDLADDNYIPSIKSAINGGTMPSVGLKAGLKRELVDEDEFSDDECLKDSYFSDTQYRRNCGTSTHESDDRGGKRRLLNVVGSVVGSIWEFCTSQMQNSLAGIIPKIGWSTAAAEYYDTPFNAPPGLFDEDVNNVSTTHNFEFARPSMPGAFISSDSAIAAPITTSFKKPTLKSLIPPSPIKEENNDLLFTPRSPDFTYLDEDLSKSRMGGTDSPMSASWILVKPESNSRASSPVRSPTMGASSASMRRSGSNSGSPLGTPIFSTPPSSGLGRRSSSYSRPVPSRKMRGVARPAGHANSNISRSGYLSRSSTISSTYSNNSFGPPSSSQSTVSSSSAYTHSSFDSYRRTSMASSVMSVGSSLPTSPTRAGASAAGQRVRGATVSGVSLSGKKKPTDEDEDMAQMDFFSKQLRALIREGKEALGSKIEVLECEDEPDWM